MPFLRALGLKRGWRNASPSCVGASRRRAAEKPPTLKIIVYYSDLALPCHRPWTMCARIAPGREIDNINTSENLVLFILYQDLAIPGDTTLNSPDLYARPFGHVVRDSGVWLVGQLCIDRVGGGEWRDVARDGRAGAGGRGLYFRKYTCRKGADAKTTAAACL